MENSESNDWKRIRNIEIQYIILAELLDFTTVLLIYNKHFLIKHITKIRFAEQIKTEILYG